MHQHEHLTEDEIAESLRGRVFVLTGAGVSVASGLGTFRGPGGMYEGKNPYQLASPQGFRDDPALVWNWYLMRIRAGIKAKPNSAHLALVELERIAREVVIVTSNVDSLHEQAGSTRVHKLHGNIMQTLCLSCNAVAPLQIKNMPSRCTADLLPTCGCGGLLRPNVVWFGEYPCQSAVHACQKWIPKSDIMLEVGHSGVVTYGHSRMAVRAGVHCVRINPDPEPEPGVTCLAEPAEVALPRLVGLAGKK